MWTAKRLSNQCKEKGCNNASKEFVKERDLFLKEYRAGLNVNAYYCSKFFPLALISVAQAILLSSLVDYFCRIPVLSLECCALMATIAVIGVTLGMVISALAKSEHVATVLVPMVLIPQIVLSSGLKPLEGVGELVAQVAVSMYWGFGVLRGTLSDDLIPLIQPQPTGRAYSTIALAIHAAVCVYIALYALKRKARTV